MISSKPLPSYKSIILLVLGLSFFSCEKENTNDCTICASCSTNTFETYIPNNSPIALTEDNSSNTIILAENDEARLIKLNPFGKKMWSVDNSNIPIGSVDIETLQDNSILVISKTEDEVTTTTLNYSYGIYTQYGKARIENCPDIYMYTTNPCNEEVKSKTIVTKFNKSGDLVWSKTFDGYACNTKSIITGNNNTFFLATYSTYGRIAEPSFIVESDGTILYTDTLNYSMDKNIINVYKVDSNGDIIWNRKLKISSTAII